MNKKHTPGPWAISRDDRPHMEWNNHIVSAGTPGLTVCLMTHTRDENNNAEGEANACLIAAAPELLAALDEVLSKVREESGSDDPMAPFAYDASWEALAIKADAAISKARGQ